jgi:hypothetical protein
MGRKDMGEPSDVGFDFEAWARLARENPGEFERRREQEIRNVIDARPDLRHRLDGLQFRIDAERKLARTPLKACLRISTLMWNRFYDLKDQLDGLVAAGARGSEPIPPASATRHAEVIPLRRPSDSDDNKR